MSDVMRDAGAERVEEIAGRRFRCRNVLDEGGTEQALLGDDIDWLLARLRAVEADLKTSERRVIEYEERLDGDEPLRTVVRKLEAVEAELDEARREIERTNDAYEASLRATYRAEAEVRRLREALVRSDSLLSLLRHRCARTIPWGTLGLVTAQDVDEVIGQSRAALTPPAPEATP